MKKYLTLVSLVACLIYGCGKNSTPTPTTPPVKEPISGTVDVSVSVTDFSPKSAEAGAEITITGNNFGNTANDIVIKIGDSPDIKPKLVTNTQIIFILPANALSGKISVRVKNNPAVKSIVDFTFIPDYIIKTIGISRVRVAFDNSDRITTAEFIGGGNRVTVKAGNDNKMEMVNNTKLEPFVEPRIDVGYPHPTYVPLAKPISEVLPPDTANALLIRLTGFDKKKVGYNQLNLVLCKETRISTAGFSGTINILYMKENKPRNTYNNSFFTKAFTGSIAVTSVELSDFKYIVRDVITDGIQIVYDEKNDNKTTTFNFFDSGLGLLKLRLNPSGDIRAGTRLKTEIVNLDKSIITYFDMGFRSFNPLLSNIKKGGFETIVLPQDTVNNVFIRVSGFDPAICGYNQLRLFPTQYTGVSDGPQLGYVNTTPKERLTMPFITQSFKTDGFVCIQLLTP